MELFLWEWRFLAKLFGIVYKWKAAAKSGFSLSFEEIDLAIFQYYKLLSIERDVMGICQ